MAKGVHDKVGIVVGHISENATVRAASLETGVKGLDTTRETEGIAEGIAEGKEGTKEQTEQKKKRKSYVPSTPSVLSEC